MSRKKVSIDHIEINDYLIEISYWVPRRKEKESVLFKTSEFESWLSGQRNVSLDNYWDHWDPLQIDSWGSKIIWNDIQHFFQFKMDLPLSAGVSVTLTKSTRKPMKKVSSSSKSKGAGSQTA